MIKHRRIYVASSWRNTHQAGVVEKLRNAGHEVYDFKQPSPGNKGFAWSEVDRDWLTWKPHVFAELLSTNATAAKGFALDKSAVDWCDTCVLVLPCGRSAHLEAGYACGQGKDCFILLHEDKFEPELMYLLGSACDTSIERIIERMTERQPGSVSRWHQENGGSFARPANHALRLLHEVIELCVAAGATFSDITHAAGAALDRAEARNEIGPCNMAASAEEWADCAMLLEVFAHYADIDRHKQIRKKLDVLWDRRWSANRGGALWRSTTVKSDARTSGEGV